MVVAHPTFGHCNNTFRGACLDSGAQRTVIGKLQVDAYLMMTEECIEFTQSKTKKLSGFGSVTHNDRGFVKIRVSVSRKHSVELFVYVVSIEVPLLLGLDVMKNLKVIINFESHHQLCKSNFANSRSSLASTTGHQARTFISRMAERHVLHRNGTEPYASSFLSSKHGQSVCIDQAG